MSEFEILLSAPTCFVVIVDVQKSSLFANGGRLRGPMTDFIRNAQSFDVPIFQTEFNDAIDSSDARSRLTQLTVTDKRNPWASEALRRLIANEKRSRVCFVGDSINGHLSMAALSALQEGFEVFVVKDLTGFAESDETDAAYSRLLRMGCVPITAAQIVAEWTANSET